jgi:hypothetical protein
MSILVGLKALFLQNIWKGIIRDSISQVLGSKVCWSNWAEVIVELKANIKGSWCPDIENMVVILRGNIEVRIRMLWGSASNYLEVKGTY